MTRNSSDGPTDRGNNNNIPELSLESAGVIIAYYIISQHLETCKAPVFK